MFEKMQAEFLSRAKELYDKLKMKEEGTYISDVMIFNVLI